jgi:hypothetical protein
MTLRVIDYPGERYEVVRDGTRLGYAAYQKSALLGEGDVVGPPQHGRRCRLRQG